MPVSIRTPQLPFLWTELERSSLPCHEKHPVGMWLSSNLHLSGGQIQGFFCFVMWNFSLSNSIFILFFKCIESNAGAQSKSVASYDSDLSTHPMTVYACFPYGCARTTGIIFEPFLARRMLWPAQHKRAGEEQCWAQEPGIVGLHLSHFLSNSFSFGAYTIVLFAVMLGIKAKVVWMLSKRPPIEHICKL